MRVDNLSDRHKAAHRRESLAGIGRHPGEKPDDPLPNGCRVLVCLPTLTPNSSDNAPTLSGDVWINARIFGVVEAFACRRRFMASTPSIARYAMMQAHGAPGRDHGYELRDNHPGLDTWPDRSCLNFLTFNLHTIPNVQGKLFTYLKLRRPSHFWARLTGKKHSLTLPSPLLSTDRSHHL